MNPITVPAPRPPRDLPYLGPTTLADALQERASHPDYTVLAGGTDVMVQLHAGVLSPVGVLDLSGIQELTRVQVTDAALHLGATVTFSALLRDPDILAGWPILVQAAASVGSVQIRNRATVGGNIVNASPSGDSLPPLAVYGATVELTSTRGSRRVPLVELFRGYKELDMAPDELLTKITVPRPGPGTIQRFRKVGTRKAQAITKVSAALLLERDGAQVTDAAISLGAVAPHVVRLPEVEAMLEGRALTPELIQRVADEVQRRVKPIDDLRSTAEYRRKVAARIVARLLTT